MDFTIFNKFLDAIFIINEEKELVYANEAFATVIGISLKRLKAKKKVFEFITFEDSELICMPEGHYGRDEVTLYKEYNFETLKGNKGKGSLSISPLAHEGKKVWLLYMRDMTLEILLQQKYREELGQKENVIEDLKEAQKELEKYSRNLEKMVEERTADLKKSNQFIQTMVNSLGQGLLVFDKEGQCHPIFTRACEKIFGIAPKDKKIDEVFGLANEKKQGFQKWVDTIFEEILPFEDVADLGPSSLEREDKFISLEYYPMYLDNKLEGVVTVATDKTRERQFEVESKKNQDYADMIIKLVKNKKQFLTFVNDARQLVESLLEKTKKENYQDILFSEILLDMHSIKGGAGVYSLREVFEEAHEVETSLEPYKENPQSFVEVIDSFHQRIKKLGETLEGHFQGYTAFLGEAIIDGEHRVEHKIKDLEFFSQSILSQENTERLYFNFLNRFVKEPAYKYLLNYSDMVTSLGTNLNKDVRPIIFRGKDVRMRPTLFGELFTTMVHVFTNAVAHGIEEKEERVQVGKKAQGKIEVSFFNYIFRGQDWVKITVQDDGKGINPEVIRKKLSEKNILFDENASDSEIVQYIFHDSFSTSETVSNISGRGVGMSALKKVVEDLGGNLLMESIPGIGSKLIINVVNY